MKKALSSIVALTMLFTMAAAGGGTKANNVPTQSSKVFRLTQPDFQKLDSELVKTLRENGKAIPTKELTTLKGKSYNRPKDTAKLSPLDARGKKKGIAILVDFPVYDKEGNQVNNDNNGKISNVPGVNYERVPMAKFNDLLNGTEYNPYELEVFKSLANYEVKDASGKVINTIKAPTDRTLRNYYKEVSYNQFQIDVDTTGWYTLPKPYDYYLGQNQGYANENGDAHIAELIKDAIDLADKDVDFSQYAVDAKPGDFGDLYGDAVSFKDKNNNTISKTVPNIFIIHRGTGAEYSAAPDIIWSHKWNIVSAESNGIEIQTGKAPDISTLNYKVTDGVVTDIYNIVPEVTKNITGYNEETKAFDPALLRNPTPAYPGVYCHEFGHVLGLPDQYDYGYESEGTGMFSLMAGGSYGRDIQNTYYNGNCPVHMDAWSKCFLGFAQPKEIKPANGMNQKITLKSSVIAPDIYKVVVPGSDGREYFLLENRQQTGYDTGLSINGTDLHGLVVYHVVEDVFVRNFHRANEAQNWDLNHLGFAQQPIDTGRFNTGETHYAISIIQADGNFDLEKANDDGNASDVFPGTSKVTSISSKGNVSPNTTSVYKWGKKSTETGIRINNIVEKDGIITCNIMFTK